MTLALHQACVVVSAIGIVGNIISFIVYSHHRFTKKSKRHQRQPSDLNIISSFSFYMRVKLVADTVILLHSVRVYIEFMWSYDFNHLNRATCKLSYYLFASVQSVSIWLLVLIGLDRLLPIFYPTLKLCSTNRKAQLTGLFSITILSLLIYLPRPINIDLMINGNVTQCKFSQTRHMAQYVYIVSFNFFLVTVVINNILAFMLIYFLVKQRPHTLSTSNRSHRDRKFLFNTVSLSLTCFVCKLPMLLNFIISIKRNLWSPEVYKMVYMILWILFILDNASNFITSFLTNSVFYEIVCSWRRLGRRGNEATRSLDRVNILQKNGTSVSKASK